MAYVYGQMPGFVSFFTPVLPQLGPKKMHNFYARKCCKKEVKKRRNENENGPILKLKINKIKNKLKRRSGVGYISLSVYLYLSSSAAIYQKIYLVVHPMVSFKMTFF